VQRAYYLNKGIQSSLETGLRQLVSIHPYIVEIVAGLLTGLLLIFSFPDFNLWPLAWCSLLPMLALIGLGHPSRRIFVAAWIGSTVFFYGSCYWLTYSMINYGGLPVWLSYILIAPPTALIGLFPALALAFTSRLVNRFGSYLLFAAPFLWVSSELLRSELLGQLWNAIGYSQAYVPSLIQTAAWGGVYLVSFLIVTVNATLAFLLLRPSGLNLLLSATLITSVASVLTLGAMQSPKVEGKPALSVVAVQANVPMTPGISSSQSVELLNRHIRLSRAGLETAGVKPTLVVWSESPMNFSYSRNATFGNFIKEFADRFDTSILFNSLEPAPNEGAFNSAVLIAPKGMYTGQYNKTELMPFGEYVPLADWVPIFELFAPVVGQFTAGTEYKVFSVGPVVTGVFICFESTFPHIARALTNKGADFLINISNDGYLGPTPVVRQHLANSIFRAVENNRPVVRVTNTGITAYISEKGEVINQTEIFVPAHRVWMINDAKRGVTFYSRYGDLFAGTCAALSLLALIASFTIKSRFQFSRR
jgi:apolipoprotein N-acyltransferase